MYLLLLFDSYISIVSARAFDRGVGCFAACDRRGSGVLALLCPANRKGEPFGPPFRIRISEFGSELRNRQDRLGEVSVTAVGPDPDVVFAGRHGVDRDGRVQPVGVIDAVPCPPGIVDHQRRVRV